MKKLFAVLMLIPSLSFGADITITIPDAVAPRALNALAAYFKYDPNSETPKVEFVKGEIAALIKRLVVYQETQTAAKAAEAQQKAASTAEIVIE